LSAGIQVVPYTHNPRPGLTYPVIGADGFVDGRSSVSVVAVGGDSIEVLDATMSVIGIGVAPQGGGEFEIPLSQIIQVGATYYIRRFGDQSVFPGLGVRRHGFPESFATGESLEKISLCPAAYHIGNAGFTYYCDITRPQGPCPAVDFTGVVVIGFENNPVVPFDNGQGVNQILIFEYWFGVTGFINQNERRGFVQWSLPLPNDPGLEGALVLAQFGILDTSAVLGFRLSEVVGFKVLGP
jgi:hypothetical protein